MKTEQRVRALRGDGRSIDCISRKLGISLQWAYKCASDVVPASAPAETDAKVVRYAPNSDGYPQPVSLRRVVCVDGVAA